MGATDEASMTRLLSATDFPVPVVDRYFEDYVAGAVYEYGSVTMDEAEIIEYATRFDPQRMHTDLEYAASGPFHGLIASGWHTAGIFMQLYVDHYLSHVASLASPGIDELRWPAPVRPGDRLRMRVTVASTRALKSKPDRGLVHTDGELLNQDDVVVLSLKAMNFLKRRD